MTHITANHGTVVTSVDNEIGVGGIRKEKKDYTTTEIKLLLKKKEYLNRPEGAAHIRTKNRKGADSNYKASASVDLETAPFEYMKRQGFVDMKNSIPDIVDIKVLRVVTADTEDDVEAEVKYISKPLYKKGEYEDKVRIKMFTTSCSIQVQSMRNSDSKNPVPPPSDRDTREFTNMIVDFVKDAVKRHPNLYEVYIPNNLEERIDTLENKETRDNKKLGKM
jgi:hypothetical protein